MLPDKSVLLDQITSAIKKNSCKDCTEEVNHSVGANSVEFSVPIAGQHYFSEARHLESLKNLEQRIEALEDQNDRLLYFIHFLYKNFPELVKDILQGEESEKDVTEGWWKFGLVSQADVPSLTRREIEILHLLVKGLCAKEIATMLFISETTVITHKKNLKEKFQARNTVELISKAFTILFKADRHRST